MRTASRGRRRVPVYMLAVGLALAGARRGAAEVGLVIEGPTGVSGFFSDAGHAAVWISRGCVDAQGTIYYCEGTPGVVLSGTDYWAKTGAAAIPADYYFLGPLDKDQADERVEWQQSMASVYPAEGSERGQQYLGRAWGRETRVLTFQTTPEEDRAAIARIAAMRTEFRFSFTRSNCSNLSRQVLQLWVGKGLRVRRWSDLGGTTPVALERGLTNLMGRAPAGRLVTYTFPDPKAWVARRQPRDLCGALMLDPKYAAPILVVYPPLYAGLGGCYVWEKLSDAVRTRHGKTRNAEVAAAGAVNAKSVDGTFEEMVDGGHEPALPGAGLLRTRLAVAETGGVGSGSADVLTSFSGELHGEDENWNY